MATTITCGVTWLLFEGFHILSVSFPIFPMKFLGQSPSLFKYPYYFSCFCKERGAYIWGAQWWYLEASLDLTWCKPELNQDWLHARKDINPCAISIAPK